MSGGILIIDPDEDQLTTLRVALQEEGYSVEVARDGLEGFEKFKELQPNLVITELMTDRLSGFELSSRIAASEEFQAPVIFYTGFYRDERARKEVVSKYGASGYFVKPFQLQALKQAVARHVGQVSAEETTIPRATEPRQELRKRFISTVLGESQPKSDPPVNRGGEGIEGAQEVVGRSVEPSLSPQHSGVVPQSLENLSEDRPAEQNDDWLAELPMFQANSPLAQDPSIAQSETISVEERVPQETLWEPEPLAVEQSIDEMPVSSFSVLSKSPEPPSFYKSRPFQILAVMVLLGVGFVLFRGPGSFVPKKPDAALQQQSGNAQPERQVSSSPTGSETVNPLGVGTEPGKSDTVSAPSVNPPPEIKGLTPNETHSVSSAAVLHDAEAISSSRGLPGEDSHATPSSVPRLEISDVTGEGGPPYLQRSKKPIVSPDMARTSKPLVVRVVIGRQGKVIEATSLNQSESNASLSRAALAAIQNWEFSPVRGKREKTWTRYFSFRFTSGSE